MKTRQAIAKAKRAIRSKDPERIRQANERLREAATRLAEALRRVRGAEAMATERASGAVDVAEAEHGPTTPT